jgi:hypothetical protein
MATVRSLVEVAFGRWADQEIEGGRRKAKKKEQREESGREGLFA